MAAQPHLLTIAEFDTLYAEEKPYYEFWAGSIAQKSMPTKFHSALQVILSLLLRESGLFAYTELRLAISQQMQVVPDVCGISRRFPGSYPTEPFEVVIEIVSPSDAMQYLYRKCRLYAEWNIQHIFVFDPEDRIAYEWKRDIKSLQSIVEIAITGRPLIPVARLWSELDAYLEPSA